MSIADEYTDVEVRDGPSLEAMFQVVEDGLLHHVGDVVALEGGADEDDGTHRGHHLEGWRVVRLKTERHVTETRHGRSDTSHRNVTEGLTRHIGSDTSQRV